MATSSEDLIASDAIENSEPIVSDDLKCTFCLKTFRSPRRLPCSHSFCQDCLRSHISHSGSVNGTLMEFYCPICGTVVRSSEVASLDTWVHLFPHNTLLLSVLMNLKLKVDLVCDVCQVQNAHEMCIVCEQALCGKCLKLHKRMIVSNTHDILKIEDLPSKQDMVLQHSSLFKCMDHVSNPVDHYCKDHEIQLCSKCFVSNHNTCSHVVDLINETSNKSDIISDIKLQIKELEDQFKRYTDINASNLRKLESQINDLTQQIRTLKNSITNALDDLETRVKIECEKIYNDERTKSEQLNNGCQSQIMAVRNSNCIIDSVAQFATESQLFMLVKRMLRQMSLLKTQIEETWTENYMLKLELDINHQLTSVVHIPRGEIAKMKMTINDGNPIIPDGFKSLKGCKAKLVDIKEIKVHGDKRPSYVDVKYVSHNLVMMLDFENKVCYLLDSLFNSLCFWRLAGYPSRVCAVGHREIALSMAYDQTIQFLSIKDNTISPTRQITTRQKCYGIAAVSHEEMIVSGPCGDDNTYYWSIITLDGKEKSYHEFEGQGSGGTYLAVNALKTSLYISVMEDNSLHCFGFEGKKYFTFKHQDLKEPRTVAIDRDDNVYVIGLKSRNIFQLSGDGNLIQLITDVIPNNPMAMCFNENSERLLLTCYEKEDLHIFKIVKTGD